MNECLHELHATKYYVFTHCLEITNDTYNYNSSNDMIHIMFHSCTRVQRFREPFTENSINCTNNSTVVRVFTIQVQFSSCAVNKA